MTVIELQDDEAALLAAKAAAEGMALKDWLKGLATKPSIEGTVQAAANIVLQEMQDVPADVMSTMPSDGANEHDHYLYGWPKQNA